jgi:hypothetical protein
MELKEEGLDVSERHVGKLMKINGSAGGDSVPGALSKAEPVRARKLIWRQKWPNRRQAEAAIFQYINGFYNVQRRQSYLGGQPLCFRSQSGIMRQVTGTKPLPAHFSRIIAH